MATSLIGPLSDSARADFSAPFNLSSGAAGQPQVASDADGDAIAVWSQLSSDETATRRVEARQISATGALGPVKALSAAGKLAWWSQVASDARGDAVAVWLQFSSDGKRHRVKARKISAGGALDRVKTLSVAGRKSRSPQIASDRDGDAVAVWSQYDGTTWRIKARRISATGALGRVKTLSAAGRKTSRPQVASDAHGDAIAVWSQYDGRTWRIKARKISAGGALGRVKTLSHAGRKSPSDEGHDAGWARIASDAHGDAVAVWSQESSGGRIKARQISATGALGPVKTLSAPSQRAAITPEIASDRDGDAVAVWSGFQRVSARQISATGALGPVTTLSTTRHAARPEIASDRDGDAITVWYGYGYAGMNRRVQARQIAAAGALGPVQTISTAGQEARVPQVASGASGYAVAVWSQLDGSGWNVWGSVGP